MDSEKKGPSGRRKKRIAAPRRTTREELELEWENLLETRDDLEASRGRYAALYDAAPVPFLTLSPSGLIREINLPGARLLGMNRRHLVGFPLASFIAKPDHKVLQSHLARCRRMREANRPISVELQLKAQPGLAPTWVDLISTPETPEGVASAISNIIVDVSERRRSFEAQRRLAAIVESSNDAILSVDLDGRLASWNGASERLFGYDKEKAMTLSIGALFPGEREGDIDGIIAKARRGERFQQRETTARYRAGGEIEVLITLAPLRDTEGRLIGASVIVHDISEIKRSERTLKAARDEAERANRAKDDFLAVLSHELRTPLNPVLLVASDFASDKSVSAELRQSFELIKRNVELEARLIDDMLDLTRITHGKLHLQMAPARLHSILREAIAIVEPDMRAKGISFREDLGAARDGALADPARLEQAFWNILKNAVKFTPQGGKISVSTCVSDEGAFVLAVSDSGIGLSQEEIRTVFDAFSQGQHANRRDGILFGGLGLGLTITRKLVEHHSGTVTVRSAGRGQGATFVVTLPLAEVGNADHPAGQRQGAQTSGPPQAPLKILVVEDHRPTCEALERLLSRRRYEVATAGSLNEALVLAKERRFDLLISDIGLPDGTGYDVLRAYSEVAPIRAIALSGFGMEADVLRSRESGFAAHLTKPVTVQELDRALSQVLA